MKKKLKVVAAIIENEYNEVLCALRSPQMTLPNMWEFPGGKVESGESLNDAIEREIMEELDCKIKALDVFHDNTHEYENVIVNLICIRCKIVEGLPTSNEHSELIWFRRENLESLRWAPADIPAVNKLISE
ncbi:(deoxy)nucleoside triphosphate pyrophosphohydrolase [Romboutsia lituseburensis]|uniref:(deoxy)nucleoside triphosphate pyrophosphohydrolase n=1 Tax=Romboutsia lituseburensis TaxID=1537 RepID=UPI0022EA4320|nr:(deoxy)nucleoside triphosphate pyrophosphohydrolase [Romboutsia lituseburensis]